MTSHSFYGYAGSVLLVNLTDGSIRSEQLAETTARTYIGGTCLGAKYLYDNVRPNINWSDPDNTLTLASGPFGGTSVPGSGTFSVVTTGALTNGATSSQANGFFGAYLKFSGFDAVVLKGASPDWVYLYIHDGTAELIDAGHLLGKDTWETEDAVKEQIKLPGHASSAYSIGPAGENLVRFAVLVGDRGHVAAHNGIGAVMGSKKLKAVVAARGKKPVSIKDRETVSAISKRIVETAQRRIPNQYEWGTSMLYEAMVKLDALPIKNLTLGKFPEYQRFIGKNYRPRLEMKRTPCWACQANHCHIVKVLEGPYAGYVGEEPEYEALAAWGSLIYQTDVGAAIMLSNEADRLGLDCNESGWLTAMLMECYEKGIITQKDTDGLELTWGNAEAVKALLHKIARREGFGAILAEGVMRAAERIGGDAPNIGVYVKKGSTPRGHDHRSRWPELFDTVTSSVGTLESGGVVIPDVLSPIEVSTAIARAKAARFFKDSLGICLIATIGTRTITNGNDPIMTLLIEMLNAVTGWDYTLTEVNHTGLVAANMLRIFNYRRGISIDKELPSPRYGSAPLEGSAKGKSIMTNWDTMLKNFYQQMGWSTETGAPLPETLQNLGLDHMLNDI